MKKEYFWYIMGFILGFEIVYFIEKFIWTLIPENSKWKAISYIIIFIVIFVIIKFITIIFFHVKIKENNHKNLKSDIKKIIKNE